MVRTTARATSTQDAAPDYLAGLCAAANEILNESHPPHCPDGDDDGVEVDDHGRAPGDNDEEELDEEVEMDEDEDEKDMGENEDDDDEEEEDEDDKEMEEEMEEDDPLWTFAA